MRVSYQHKRLGNLEGQRNVLGALVVILFVTNTLQGIRLFFRHERTIIVPPELRQEFWVEGQRFAPSYMQEMALYFAHLLLNVSPTTLGVQGDIVLRYVNPEAYGTFRTKFMADATKLSKDNASLGFHPISTKVLPDALVVEITGDLLTYMGSKVVSIHRETYRLAFTHQQGRLGIKSFTCIHSDNPHFAAEETCHAH
jgi:conjugal transfer pilus assembly protein TraE